MRRHSRSLLATLVGLATAAAVTTPAAGNDPPAQDGTVTDLGVAMRAPNVRLADVDVLADGTPVGYLFSDGEPVTFNVVDLRTGELVDSHELPPYAVASSIDVAEDDAVYLSVRSPNDGTLWTYDPATGELREIATGVAGEQMLRTLDVDGGTLYGTTYPNAELYAMDLESEQITEYGRIAASGDYAWGLEAHAGQVWVGAGTPAQLYAVDPSSGSATALPLPEDVAASGGFIQRIETHGDLRVLSHRVAGGTNVTVTDHQGDVVDRIFVDGLWNSTETSVDGAFYFLGADGMPHAYDIAARASRPVDMSASGAKDHVAGTTRVFLAELGVEDFPGTTLLGVRTDGQVWRHNLSTGTGDVLPAAGFGSPVTTMSIGEGGDGQIYVGAYLSPGVMARVDPGTGVIEQLDGPEQADSIAAHGDQTVIGSYPDAVFHVAEAGAPWAWGTNPRHVLTLGRAATGQDRPRSLVSAGDVVAAGTIANYGELGGALTLFDPDTGEHSLHRDVVPEQSIAALAYADGVVYAGTSIYGGLSSTPTQTTAEVFAWDVAADALVASGPVVEGAEVIHALAADGAGSLYGMTDTGVVFEYDTATHEVVRTVQTDVRNGNIWGDQSDLAYNADDGMLYGNAGGRLLRIDPATLEPETLVPSGVRNSTVAHGHVWFTDETNVFRYDLAPACDRTITGTHDGPVRADHGRLCLLDADVRGPVSVVGGASLLVEGSTVVGPLRTDGAAQVVLRDSAVTGPVTITGSTGRVAVSGTTVNGPLTCAGNVAAPDVDAATTVTGPARGQCAVAG